MTKMESLYAAAMLALVGNEYWRDHPRELGGYLRSSEHKDDRDTDALFQKHLQSEDWVEWEDQ